LFDIFHARVHEVVHSRAEGGHWTPRLNGTLVQDTVALIIKTFVFPKMFHRKKSRQESSISDYSLECFFRLTLAGSPNPGRTGGKIPGS